MASCRIRVRPQGLMLTFNWGDSPPHQHENKQRGKAIAAYRPEGHILLWVCQPRHDDTPRTSSRYRDKASLVLYDYSHNPNPEKYMGHLFIRSSHFDTPP
uniref:Questionable protein n=1 Tax=Neurospora crassa TaxID=5141 RepID=Q6MW45_NEUCS|nr:questionable protein [Neurospora crassa]